MISAEKIEQLLRYQALVLEWNQKLNLTAVIDPKEFIIKHLIDSLSVISCMPIERAKLVDVGTGAGFPGIPLSIVHDSLETVLLDSLKKRVQFLETCIHELSIPRVDAIHDRAEDAGNNSYYREKFDVAISRAVARLPVLLEYCLPFVRVGGTFLAMKGLQKEELEDSKRALQVLGGELIGEKKFTLPFSDYQRTIFMIKKFRQTPTKYPRKSGKPSSDPL